MTIDRQHACALLTAVLMATFVAKTGAQTPSPAPPPPSSPATAPAGEQVDPVVRQTLEILQDRPKTLKDFQAKIDYSVYHQSTGESDGKRGTVDFVNDPKSGPEFSARFTLDTVEGNPVKKHPQEMVFDGTHVTLIDELAKTYTRRDVAPPGGGSRESGGGGAGDATSLNGGEVVLPIGLKVEEVLKNFEVSAEKVTPEEVVLKLVPREEVKGKFDFKSLELTVNRKLELPMKVVRVERKGDVTTIDLKDAEINTGKARMVDTGVPSGGEWRVDVQ